MVKVKGVEGVLITADSYTELIKAVKNEFDNYDGFEPKAKFLNEREAIVYHDEIIEDVPPAEWEGRYCCECTEYDWGKGCPYREGHITLKMDACEHFTIEIKEATK